MNPLHLLKLEWCKFFPNGTFRVFVALYAGSFAMVVFLARSIGRNMSMETNGTTMHPLAGMFTYPADWSVVACIGSWMNLFVLGTLGVFMITMEFSNKTLRQSVIFGMTRMEVALSKLLWAAALALGATGLYLVLTLGGEILSGGLGGPPPASPIICFFLQALGYLLLGNLVGLVMRQTALAVLGYLAYALFLETVVRWIFYYSIFKTRALLFLPDQVLGSLTPLPGTESITQMLGSNPATSPLTISEAVVSAVIYLGLFAAFSTRRIARADL